MKIYLSQESRKIIRKNYPRLINEEMYIIDTPIIISEFHPEEGYKLDRLDSYMINQIIERRLNAAYQSKRYKNVLYLVDKINRRFLYGFRKYLKESNIFFTDFILLDYSQNLDEKLYKFFDNIL